jgi:hypothetical protein
MSFVKSRYKFLEFTGHGLRLIDSFLGLAVNIGGIVGLFLGASILSLIEIFFLIVDMINNRNLRK